MACAFAELFGTLIELFELSGASTCTVRLHRCGGLRGLRQEKVRGRGKNGQALHVEQASFLSRSPAIQLRRRELIFETGARSAGEAVFACLGIGCRALPLFRRLIQQSCARLTMATSDIFPPASHGPSRVASPVDGCRTAFSVRLLRNAGTSAMALSAGSGGTLVGKRTSS